MPGGQLNLLRGMFIADELDAAGSDGLRCEVHFRWESFVANVVQGVEFLHGILKGSWWTLSTFHYKIIRNFVTNYFFQCMVQWFSKVPWKFFKTLMECSKERLYLGLTQGIVLKIYQETRFSGESKRNYFKDISKICQCSTGIPSEIPLKFIMPEWR